MRAICLLFIVLFLASCRNKHLVIAIQPIGNVSGDRIEIAKQALDSAYQARIIILPSISPPKETFVNVKVPRYRADKLIAYLKEVKPDTVDYIMGLTGYDISITKHDMLGRIKEPKSLYEDFGIFGLGYKPGKSCIVSYYRLGADAAMVKTRLAKICTHELGHNFGLDHCPNKKCVMADAVEKISTIDNAEGRLCERCKNN